MKNKKALKMAYLCGFLDFERLKPEER